MEVTMKSLVQKCLTDIICVVSGRSVPSFRVFHTARNNSGTKFSLRPGSQWGRKLFGEWSIRTRREPVCRLQNYISVTVPFKLTWEYEWNFPLNGTARGLIPALLITRCKFLIFIRKEIDFRFRACLNCRILLWGTWMSTDLPGSLW